MSETPAANTPESRAPTGEIKDQTTAPLTPDPKTETKPGETPPSTEKKPDEVSLANKKDETKPPEQKAPEKYEPWKAPEGFEIDAEASKTANELFKSMNLTQEQGQKIIDLHAQVSKEAAEAPFAAYREMRDGWRKEVAGDPKLGNGTDLKPEVKASINAVITSFADPALEKSFRDAMDLTGAGDNPAFVRGMTKLGELLKEGKHVAGNGPAPVKKPGEGAPSIAKAMYPNNP